MTKRQFRSVTALVCLFSVLLSWQVAAQEVTRGPSGGTPGPAPAASPLASPVAPGEKLDLAAMALDSTDIPPEFLLTFETYLAPDTIAERLVSGVISQEEVDATGLIGYYDSSYSTPDGTARIRSYLQEYGEETGAAAGFALFEDEQRIVPDFALSDEPGPGIGEEPSEITSGAFAESVPATGPTNIDVTFRIGRIIAGVSMDTGEEITVDRDLVLDLAGRLETRINEVLAGNSPELIELSLPGRFVGLGDSWLVTNEGYWAVPEVYGPDAPPEIAAGFISGYFRADAFDPERLGGFPLPRVAISVAEFDNEQSPLLLLSNLETLQPAFVDLAQSEIDPISGSSVTLGYSFANSFMSDASVDSFRIVTLVDSTMVIVDVQGNGTVEAARAAAVEIATEQVACAASDQPCEVESFPAALFSSPSTPTPGEPVG